MSLAGHLGGRRHGPDLDLSIPAAPRLAQTLPRGTMYVPDLEFSPDGRLLVTAGYDNRAAVWRVRGTAVTLSTTLPADTDVMAVGFAPSGRYVARATYEQVTLWDLSTPTAGRRLGSFPISDKGLVNVSFSSEGRTLAVAIGDVALWNVSDPRTPVRRSVLRQAGYSAAFSPTSSDLATFDVNGVVTIWKTTDPAHPVLLDRPQIAGGSYSDDRSLAFSPDGGVLVCTAKLKGRVTTLQITVPQS